MFLPRAVAPTLHGRFFSGLAYTDQQTRCGVHGDPDSQDGCGDQDRRICMIVQYFLTETTDVCMFLHIPYGEVTIMIVD